MPQTQTTPQNEMPPPAASKEASAVREPEEEGWPFAELREAVEDGGKRLMGLPHLNPQSLRDFLVGDLYTIVGDLVTACDQYIADLHNRLMDVEDEDEGLTEYVEPAFVIGLLEFVGRTVHIGQKVAAWSQEKGDNEVTENIQLLMTSAPAVIARLQELLKQSQELELEEEEGDDYEEDDEEDETPEVRVPTRQAPLEAAESGAVDDKGQLSMNVEVTSDEPAEVTEVPGEAPEQAPEPSEEAVASDEGSEDKAPEEPTEAPQEQAQQQEGESNG